MRCDELLDCHVYRDLEQPAFITAPAFENPALDAMVNGAHFGDVLDVLLTLRAQDIIRCGRRRDDGPLAE